LPPDKPKTPVETDPLTPMEHTSWLILEYEGLFAEGGGISDPLDVVEFVVVDVVVFVCPSLLFVVVAVYPPVIFVLDPDVFV
jgi:hypothetical protein